MDWIRLSTTHHRDYSKRRFRVTHPYHPLFQREFEWVDYRQNWGEDRVYFYDEGGQLTSLPARWTSVVGEDPFVVIGGGRSYFRVEDLIELVRLVEGLRS